MSYNFKINDNVCILNFSENYPTTRVGLVESDAYKEILSMFFKNLKTQKGEVYNFIDSCCNHD